MVLVDREITALAQENGLIEPFHSEDVTNIGYDLSAEYFITDKTDREKKKYVFLNPGESAFVATIENIDLHTNKNLLGRISLKNSRIRQGLRLDAPIYQPGHHTKVFFRLTNVSGNGIRLSANDKYAMISFEKLTSEPDTPYAGAFSDEFDFTGMGEYQNIYSEQIQEIERKTEDLKSMERTIYANVLVIITVFVALFSFITTNFSLISASASIKQFLVYNFVLLGCISFLVALLNGLACIAKSGKHIWVASIISFLVAIVIFIL